MEYLLIGESKVKIVLNKEETIKYKLPNGGTDGVEMRRALWRILDESAVKDRFLDVGARLLIQSYRTEWGAEIFVTKLSFLSDETEKLLQGSREVTLLKNSRIIYRFHSSDAMLDALARPDAECVIDFSSVYVDEIGDYYIVISPNTFSDEYLTYSFLNEFGSELENVFFCYLTEHARLLFDKDVLMEIYNKSR